MRQGNGNKNHVDRFHEESQAQLDRYFPQEKSPKQTLYHYTTFDCLKNIIESKELWMTEYRYLNDASEVSYALKILALLIQEASVSSNNSLFWQRFSDTFLNNAANKLNIYVASFCERKNYLPAWRWYANDGKGFSIGFRGNFFTDYRKNSYGQGYKYEKIKYIKEEQNSNFKSLITELIHLVENYLSTENTPLSKYEYEKEVFIRLSLLILPLLTKHKHTAYQEEIEHRYYSIQDLANNRLPIKTFYRKVSTDSPHVGSIPSSAIDFSTDDISEIWIGPCCRFEHAKEEIIRLLKINEYDLGKVSILRSNIPYRNNK